MKKTASFFSFLIVALSLCLSGCFKYSANMVIKSDRSVELGIQVMAAEQFSSLFSGVDVSNLADTDATITDITENGYVGKLIQYTIRDIDQISSEDDVAIHMDNLYATPESNIYFHVDKGILSSHYSGLEQVLY